MVLIFTRSLNIILYYSDIVIGFFSNMLIEAQILGKQVLRYLPLSTKNDPLNHLNVGEIVELHSLMKYIKELNK